jgi:formate--tetrahydrofolate ligase
MLSLESERMLDDIDIAQRCELESIVNIAKKIGLTEDDIELYGKYKAKISINKLKTLENEKDGKLILVTSINPTKAGEGKTTTSIGLADSLNRIGHNTILCLREPSLGPCFGIKGGACGGGYAQIVPMEDINLHFTGDFHAITSATNLLAAMIDNSIYYGNSLNIDPKTIAFKRVLDLNDRALRECLISLGGPKNGIPRETGFNITAASEIMAILCLSEDLMDLKARLANITIGCTYDGVRITASDLRAEGAMTLLLKDAIKPNLVQTLEGTPTLVHGGPFANIAHGCNSLIATKTALKLADYVVTEAGFGADLGAEKFFDLKCRVGNLKPDLTVIVATVRALKMHGGVDINNLKEPNVSALETGFANLEKHIENVKRFGTPYIVAINHFATDSKEEIEFLENKFKSLNIDYAYSDVFAKGSFGGIDFATSVVKKIKNEPSEFQVLYEDNLPIKEKIQMIVEEIYGANEILYSDDAEDNIRRFTEEGFSSLPICIAKTQYSLSDDEKLLGKPTDFTFHIRDVKLSSGAGFIVVLAGNIMTMPGLPKDPIACNIDIFENGTIEGLF